MVRIVVVFKTWQKCKKVLFFLFSFEIVLLSSWLIWTFLAHNREVKKVAFVKDDAAQRYLLITCSHDSVKVWTL